ncbi:hypothetical protein [Flavobacterium sp.]|uniref:hypothetical protein n=1 Tax=Flavobacterium sp. TaxID=239 RepID=UPI002637F850|nr:hypothetical protein [Flavobacterium sp.]MDD2986177.1 hypothetical protein [Flavobacterium sp.]
MKIFINNEQELFSFIETTDLDINNIIQIVEKALKICIITYSKSDITKSELLNELKKRDTQIPFIMLMTDPLQRKL